MKRKVKIYSLTGVGISDDGLIQKCLPQNCLPVGNLRVGICEIHLHSQFLKYISCDQNRNESIHPEFFGGHQLWPKNLFIHPEFLASCSNAFSIQRFYGMLECIIHPKILWPAWMHYCRWSAVKSAKIGSTATTGRRRSTKTPSSVLVSVRQRDNCGNYQNVGS